MSKLVVFVDDDEHLLRGVESTIKRFDEFVSVQFRFLVYSRSAYDFVLRNANKIDVLIIDLNLGQGPVSAFDFIELVPESAKVALMSGFASDKIHRRFQAYFGSSRKLDACLGKPFGIEELKSVILDEKVL